MNLPGREDTGKKNNFTIKLSKRANDSSGSGSGKLISQADKHI